MDPFKRMYNSFSVFGKAVKQNKQKFYPLSSGVNWTRANSAMLKLLHYELDTAMSYRNYGNSGGSKIVTDLLADIEKKRTQSGLKPSVLITNGSSEGSYLVFEYLKKTNYLKDGDTTMMISHGFPLYAKLSAQFKLNFVECLSKEDSTSTFLYPMDQVLEDIDTFRPKMIFLLLPNNPLGERYSDDELLALRQKCREHNVKILIDRVCLMPWDNYDQLNQVFIEDIIVGNVFIVDSMSKAESLAGVRTGYLIANKEVSEGITNIVQYRNLNPIVYSTFSMVISKMFSMTSQYEAESRRIFRLYDFFEEELFSGYPSDEKYEIENIVTKELFDEYQEGLKANKNHIQNNFATLKEVFSDEVIRDLVLESGYNAALSTAKMKTVNQYEDQKKLAFNHNVGVLPEFCFRASESESKNYFIRIGLTLPADEFKIAALRTKDYYTEEY